jgi:hypothetical protein
MQGIVSGGLLVVAFMAVAGLALVVVGRLYRISRPRQAPARSPVWEAGRPRAAGRAGEPPDA